MYICIYVCYSICSGEAEFVRVAMPGPLIPSGSPADPRWIQVRVLLAFGNGVTGPGSCPLKSFFHVILRLCAQRDPLLGTFVRTQIPALGSPLATIITNKLLETLRDILLSTKRRLHNIPQATNSGGGTMAVLCAPHAAHEYF